MLTPEEKSKIVEKYELHKQDTGSPEVQIAYSAKKSEDFCCI